MCNFLVNCWSHEAVLLRTIGVLISTLSPEKDSLLVPKDHEKIAHQILKNEGFWITLYLLLFGFSRAGSVYKFVRR